MAPVKNPCTKDCAGRSATCHSDCDAYAAYYAYRRELDRQRLEDHKIIEARLDGIHRMRSPDVYGCKGGLRRGVMMHKQQ